MTSEELEEKLDVVPCVARLFPPRLWAVQLIAEQALDELIDSAILEGIPALTDQEPFVTEWRFSLESMAWRSTTSPDERSWQEQFLEDLRTFGLREALIYMADYEFTIPPAPLFENGIAVYHGVAKLFLSAEAEIERSDAPLVKRLRAALELYGEGSRQVLRVPAPAKRVKSKRRK